MSVYVKETKNNELFKKKRKNSLIKDECDPGYSDLKVKKIKNKKSMEKFSNDFLSHNQTSSKYLHYKNTCNYTSVIANPDSLQAAPKIFKTNEFTNLCSDSSDSLLYNVISSSSFNSDIHQRFNHMGLICPNVFDWVKPARPEKLNVTSDENDKLKSNKSKGKKLKNKDSNNKRMSVIEEDCILNKIKIYNLKENNGVIFHMHHKSSFTFHGEIKIRVLSGEVEILGFTLNQSSTNTSVDVYSPNFFTALVVETKPIKENKSKVEMEFLLQDYLTEVDLKDILNDFTSNDAVLLITQINSIFGMVLNKYWDEPVFSKDLEDVSSECKTIKSVQSVFNFKLSSKGKHFNKNPEWDDIPLGHCTVLCGGKGVGKSTLLKYYVNKTLAEGEKVLCLDFDIGQPEFTISGCISAVIVDQPLLGPNFTHVTDPVLMMCFGDVDVALNPGSYLDCVKYVIEICKKNEEFLKMKWFVNTMGFCKGLGIHLMTTIIKLLQPNTVIQIQGFCKNNYPLFLTSTNLNSLAGFKSMPLKDVQVSHDLHVIKSYAAKVGCRKKGELSQGALKPRQLRDILMLSYFSKMVSAPYYNFNAVQPYLIPFSQLYLGIHSLIELNDILKAFNANLVSLMHFEPDSDEIFSVDSEVNDYFKIVVKPKLTPCLGLGFVRGIDVKEKKFYVMTHLPLEILNKVNCLCLERISPPHSMFLKQETVEGQTFYTTIGTVGLIQRVKRMFHASATIQNKEKFNV